LEIPGLAPYFLVEDHADNDMYQLIKPIFTAAYADKFSDDEDELIP
jgi:hypothetical protein